MSSQEAQPILPIFGEETVWYHKEPVRDPTVPAYLQEARTEVISVNEIDLLEDQLLRSVLWNQFGRRTAPSSSPLSRKALIVTATADNQFRSKMPVRRTALSLLPPDWAGYAPESADIADIDKK
jgi:hypothetical protein